MKIDFQEHLMRLFFLIVGMAVGATTLPMIWLVIIAALIWWMLGVLMDIHVNPYYPRLNYHLSSYWKAAWEWLTEPGYVLKDYVRVISWRPATPPTVGYGTIMAIRKRFFLYRYLVYFDNPELAPKEFTWFNLL